MPPLHQVNYGDLENEHPPVYCWGSSEPGSLLRTNTGTTTKKSSSPNNSQHQKSKSLNATSTKRVVSFAPKAKVRRTLHIKQYTQEEIEDCWVSREESAAIKKQVRLAAHLLEKGLLIDSENVCSKRGIEARTKEETLQRRKVRNETLHAILDEQSLQREMGFYDDDAFALVYPISSECQLKAHATALLDQLQITES